MNVIQLKYFVSVARLGSIAKASRQEYVKPQTISHALHEMERELGIDLFVRSTKGVALTAFGSAFLHSAEQLLEKWDRMLEMPEAFDVSHGVRDAVKIGVSSNALMENLAVRAHSGLITEQKMSIAPFLCSASECLVALNGDLLDAALIAIVKSLGQLYHDNGLVIRRIGWDPLYAAMDESHSFAGKAELTWDDLSKMTFAPFQNAPLFELLFLRRCFEQGFVPLFHDSFAADARNSCQLVASCNIARSPFNPHDVFVPLALETGFYFDIVFAYRKNKENASVLALGDYLEGCFTSHPKAP